jgi:hypothetical protein
VGDGGLVCILWIFRDTPVIIGMFTPAQQLHKLFIVCDYDQLKVSLCSATLDDPMFCKLQKMRQRQKDIRNKSICKTFNIISIQVGRRFVKG